MSLGNFEILDISPMIHAGIGVFPGDTPFQQTWLLDQAKGDGFTLSKIETTVHLGAHTDAPSHYDPRGETIEKRPLDLYLGLAQVIEVHVAAGARIGVHDLNTEILAPRVLFKTRSFPDPDRWNSDFNSLSVELVEHLANHRVRLVGIDTPSVDPEKDATLESHHAIYARDMAILEGIVLDSVTPGMYQLIALPLRMLGADATPVRAVLLREIRR